VDTTPKKHFNRQIIIHYMGFWGTLFSDKHICVFTEVQLGRVCSHGWNCSCFDSTCDPGRPASERPDVTLEILGTMGI
jgi:hypothetical protein